MSNELLSTAEAAARLGLTIRAVQKMIEVGRLQATRVGQTYVIAPEALENIPRNVVGRKPNSAKSATAPTKKRGRKAA